jgi:hypothetical protein
MRHLTRRQLVGLGVCLLGFTVHPGAQAPAKPPVNPDGSIISELSLLARTASVAIAPDLRATDPAHQNLLATAGKIEGRVRLGQLQTNGVIRFGSLTVGKPGPVLRYIVSLEGTGDGWQLDIATAPAAGGAESAAVGKIPLSRQPATIASPTLVAALIPVARDAAQLVVKWGAFKGATDLQFQEMQPPPRAAMAGRAIQPINRRHDAENIGARQTMLSQLNETALVLPKGPRFSVTFARTFLKGAQTQSTAGTTRRPGPVVDGADFAKLATIRDGAIVELTESPALKLSIDRPVRVGKLLLKTGNQAPGFPGAYSLWLKRAGRGWRLVFNQEPDVWGTQREPRSDIGEVDLTYSQGSASSRPLSVALEPSGADRWRLVIGWGLHEWTAEFVEAG